MNFESIALDFCVLAILLLVGVAIRGLFRPLRKYFIPAAILGGLVGVFLGPNFLKLIDTANYSSYTEVLTTVVFSCIFLGKRIPAGKEILRLGGAQTSFAVFGNFMQMGAGLLVAALFGLHSGFGMQLVLAFQGGPGVPSAFSELYEELGWSMADAAAVGETLAVIGLAAAVFIGLALANLGARRGYFATPGMNILAKGESQYIAPEKQKPLGKQILDPGAATPLALAVAFVGIVVVCSVFARDWVAGAIPSIRQVPAFSYSLVFGLLAQLLAQKFDLDKYIDRGAVTLIQGFAMDILIVAAIASIFFGLVAGYALPLLAIAAIGIALNVLWTIYLGPRMLPGPWLEKALGEFGKATGSNNEGLMLLRTVDPGMETEAADAFGIKMFLTSPTMVPLMSLVSTFAARKGSGLAIFLMAVGCLGCILISLLFKWWYRRDVSWFSPPKQQ